MCGTSRVDSTLFIAKQDTTAILLLVWTPFPLSLGSDVCAQKNDHPGLVDNQRAESNLDNQKLRTVANLPGKLRSAWFLPIATD